MDEATILHWASEAERYRNLANSTPPAEHGQYMEYFEAYDFLEEWVLRAPCISRKVAAVQLRMSHQSLEGYRADGLDLRSLEKVIAFLGAH